MAQLTIRLDDELAEHCKQVAADEGQSVNSWVVMVLRTRTDPAFTGPGVERTRERFRRAGILADHEAYTGPVPTEEELAEARRQASGGTSLADLVSLDREERDEAVAGATSLPEA